MTNRYLKTTSKLIMYFIIFIIFLYAAIYIANISNLQISGYGIYSSVELQCLKSICINRNGIKECIVMKVPILIKSKNIRDINYYSGNVYELQFDVISDRCE